MAHATQQVDAKLDLVFERIVNLSPERIWQAWTEPKHIVHWFTPAPWKTIDCEIDLRPGGIFSTMMQSPEGQNFPNVGCFLELVKNRKLVWTNALEPGFRPANLATFEGADCGKFAFTAEVSMAPHADGTRYRARAMHQDENGRKQHQQMGFEEGWGKALEQLVAYMQGR